MIESIGMGPSLSGFPEPKTRIGNVKEGEESFGARLRDRILEHDKFSRPQNENKANQNQGTKPDKVEENNNLEGKSSPGEKDFAKDVIAKSRFQGSRGKTKSTANEKEKVMQKFMDSFESELSIPPTRIVEAMAKLKTDELVAPASETLEAVVQQLNLNENDAVKAKALYSNLVSDLQKLTEESINQSLPQSVSKASTANLIEDQSQLNFAEGKSLKEPLSSEKSVSSTKAEKFGEGSQLWKEGDFTLDGGEYRGELIKEPFDTNHSERQTMAKGFEKESIPNLNSVDLESQKTLSPQLNDQAKKVDDYATIPAISFENQNPLPIKKNTIELNGAEELAANQGNIESVDSRLQQLLKNGAESFKDDKEGGGSKDREVLGLEKKSPNTSPQGKIDGFFPDVQITEGSSTTSDKSAISASVNGSSTSLIAANDQQETEANIQQIMNQANYLVKKGGGEMKVRLHPEGLGELQIRVSLSDGKLNLSMKADNDEAKKLIEKGIPDLKTGLSTHQLSLESVKVDLAANSGSAEQGQPDFRQQQHQQQAKDQVQEYWNQFRQNFGSSRQQRDGAFDVPALRAYGKKSQPPLDPIEVSEAKSTVRQRNGNKGLDLVA